MSSLQHAITKLSACVASEVMPKFTPDEVKALLDAVEGKEKVLALKVPVVIGIPGVFVSKGSVSVFLSYDREHDISMNVIAHQAKKLMMEILDGKVD